MTDAPADGIITAHGTDPEPLDMTEQPHDTMFRRVFDREDLCVEIFRLLLDDRRFGLFDWDRLRINPASFAAADGRKSHADLVLEVPVKGTGGTARMLLLVEHKSYKDAVGTPLQMLGYLTRLHLKEAGSRSPILPVVLYHGREPWSGPLRFQSIFGEAHGTILREFGGHFLDFDCKILNLRDMDIPKEAEGLTCKPVLYILQRIWGLDDRTVRTFSEMVKDVGDPRTRDLFLDAGAAYMERVHKQYSGGRIMGIMKDTLGDEFISSFRKQAREEGREEAREEGREEGREEEKTQIAWEMLTMGMDAQAVHKATKMPMDKVEALRRQRAGSKAPA